MRVHWTTPALRDLKTIGDYIAKDSRASAAKIISRIFNQTDMLATTPHMGRGGRVPNTRELVISETPFIVPHRVRGDEVQILAVFHGARRWPESFE
jgi:toxin ParE1/3/4